MLLYRLKELECSLEKLAPQNMELLNTVIDLKNLLLRINHKYEKMPEYSFEKICRLLEELNGKPLTGQQEQLIEQILK